MTPHEKAVEAAAKKLVSVRLSLPMTFAEQSSAAITAYLASMEAQGWVMVPTPARDPAIEAACLAYWPSHWRDHMTDADKNSIREHMRAALNAAMIAAQEG